MGTVKKELPERIWIEMDHVFLLSGKIITHYEDNLNKLITKNQLLIINFVTRRCRR